MVIFLFQEENKNHHILTSAKSGFGVLNIGNNQIIIIGGKDILGISQTTELYDYDNYKVKKLSNMCQKRTEFGFTLGLDNKIYVLGGIEGKNKYLNSAERYDINNNKWETINNMNFQRRAPQAVSLPDGIYVIGGFDGKNYLNSCEKYDEISNKWTIISCMNYSRCWFSAVASNDNQYIYVLGGFNNQVLKSIERYDIIEEKWDILENINNQRYMHNCIFINGQYLI
ncbi:kelch motif family protein, putative [Ichthyophthirius multifiliis]|uniref:Kelch motif family protein, putative n=1 Tax=Ichthyophthirius multifiliis TaxID=5932 RepID=G0QNF0_ICHMU|nr:kelch motif family protein, putative [Ichthyophthirius multifiliis]EGR33255.1 kelch motif family protein, putative [Ichthyophthirius multifiliis]|eukprot:XP_004037241.1 kelch motif family protein, putative [Ichthyophthirius multifiliis]